MAHAIRIDQPVAEHHVAAAFAVDAHAARLQPPSCPRENSVAPASSSGMQLRIAARQVDRVGIVSGRLVGKRREEGDLRPAPPPAEQHMLVAKGKGDIARDGDAAVRAASAGAILAAEAGR